MFCWHLHVLNLVVLMLGFISVISINVCFKCASFACLVLCSLKQFHSSACDVVMVVCSVFSTSLLGGEGVVSDTLEESYSF